MDAGRKENSDGVRDCFDFWAGKIDAGIGLSRGQVGDWKSGDEIEFGAWVDGREIDLR